MDWKMEWTMDWKMEWTLDWKMEHVMKQYSNHAVLCLEMLSFLGSYSELRPAAMCTES